MYHIFTFENGQPAILYQENNSVYLYVIVKGKVISKGVLFNDVKSALQIFGNSPYHIYYISTDNYVKVYSTAGQLISETAKLSLSDQNNQNPIISIHPFLINNNLLIFYLKKMSCKNTCLFCLLNVTTNLSLTLAENVPTDSIINISTLDNTLHIFMKINASYSIFCLNEQNKLIKISDDSKMLTDQIKNLEEKILTKESQINKLKSTQVYISDQYNDLAEYTGKLQDELRKLRYMM